MDEHKENYAPEKLIWEDILHLGFSRGVDEAYGAVSSDGYLLRVWLRDGSWTASVDAHEPTDDHRIYGATLGDFDSDVVRHNNPAGVRAYELPHMEQAQGQARHLANLYRRFGHAAGEYEHNAIDLWPSSLAPSEAVDRAEEKTLPMRPSKSK